MRVKSYSHLVAFTRICPDERSLTGEIDWLLRYIVDSKFGKGLSAGEVDSVARAFSSLARMDPDFGARADVVADAKRATADAGALGEPARA